MRRLLQFAAIAFIFVTLLTPLLECFDRWDAAGLSNDTEFACFAVVLLLCLVLLVSVAVAAWAKRSQMTEEHELLKACDVAVPGLWHDGPVAVVEPTGTPPPLRLPLRI